MSEPTIIDALHDPSLFGEWLGDPTSWAAWIAILKGAFGLPMTRSERRTFHKLTQRKPPKKQVRELWIIAGRRSGKSAIVSLIATFYATLQDHSAHLRPGERATVFCIAADRAQARTVFRYIRALLNAPLFDGLIQRETNTVIDLTNRISIEVGTCSYRSLRGYSCPVVIADELAFWRDESSVAPDVEVLNSIRPALATFKTPLLCCISSPYKRSGALWEAYRDHYGRDDSDVLVVKASSLDLNPVLDQKIIDDALVRDPAAARAEWLGEFRTDIESFVSVDAVRDVVVPGRRELPPVAEVAYVGFCDPSGGARDSMTVSVAHLDCESGRAVLDAIRERRAPFNPDDVTREFSELLQRYRCGQVFGDRYAGEWPRERFREHQIDYVTSDKTKSDLYLALLPELNSGQVELLDHDRLIAQICGLERRTSRSGKDSIDHGPRGFDDVVNSVAGALWLAKGDVMEDWSGGGPRCIPRVQMDTNDMNWPAPSEFDSHF